MSETPEQRRTRLRWLTLAEIVAIVAVTISGIGLWKSWRDGEARPAPVVIQTEKSIPLTLRAAVQHSSVHFSAVRCSQQPARNDGIGRLAVAAWASSRIVHIVILPFNATWRPNGGRARPWWRPCRA